MRIEGETYAYDHASVIKNGKTIHTMTDPFAITHIEGQIDDALLYAILHNLPFRRMVDDILCIFG